MMKNNLNKFQSDSSSIRFKKYVTTDSIFLVIDDLVTECPAREIMGIFLHEIGHKFGTQMLPAEYAQELLVQERFADAFATKFGYGVDLIRALKKLNYVQSTTVLQYLNKYIGENYHQKNFYSSKMNKLRQLMEMIKVAKYPKSIQRYDPHPSNMSRFKNMLSQLYIELGNPRLNKLKRNNYIKT